MSSVKEAEEGQFALPEEIKKCSVCTQSLVTSNPLWPLALWPTRILCHWNFPGKNTGVGCHSYSRGSSRPRDQTHISWNSCICRHILYHWATWEASRNALERGNVWIGTWRVTKSSLGPKKTDAKNKVHLVWCIQGLWGWRMVGSDSEGPPVLCWGVWSQPGKRKTALRALNQGDDRI